MFRLRFHNQLNVFRTYLVAGAAQNMPSAALATNLSTPRAKSEKCKHKLGHQVTHKTSGFMALPHEKTALNPEIVEFYRLPKKFINDNSDVVANFNSGGI